MRYVFILFLCASTFSFGEPFISGTDDVPIMEGFQECSPETQGLFSTPEGRIVTTVARGHGKWEDVRTFYNTTLKNLGWKSLSSSSKKVLVFHRRNKEKLTISFVRKTSQSLFIQFDLIES